MFTNTVDRKSAFAKTKPSESPERPPGGSTRISAGERAAKKATLHPSVESCSCEACAGSIAGARSNGMSISSLRLAFAKPACLSGEWPSVPSARNNGRGARYFSKFSHLNPLNQVLLKTHGRSDRKENQSSIDKIRESALCFSGRQSHLAADRSWTCWQNRRSRNYTRKRSENFSRPLAGCTDDREAKITLGSTSFVGGIKGTDRERRAAARAETAEGKRAGVQKNRGLEEALLKIAEIWQDVDARRRRRRHRTQTN